MQKKRTFISWSHFEHVDATHAFTTLSDYNIKLHTMLLFRPIYLINVTIYF